MELDQLDDLLADERRALGFTTFAVGVFLTALICSLGTAGLSPHASALFFAVLLCSFACMMWWGRLSRLRRRKARMERVRTSCRWSSGG